MTDSVFSDVRIWHKTTQYPVGVGFVADERHIITCAHVIADAMGNRQLASVSEMPSAEVHLDFPALADSTSRDLAKATVKVWKGGHPGTSDDVAILLLHDPIPHNIRPASICREYRPNDRFRAFGVRRSLPNGAFVEGKLQGNLPGPLIQIAADSEDTALREGCSGGAAWNVTRGGVVGMAVAAMQERSGLLVPIETIAKIFKSATGALLTGAAPGGGADLGAASYDSENRRKLLQVLPLGPAVDPFIIKPALKRAFASATDLRKATGIIGEANAFVIDALPERPHNPHAYTILLFDLPNSEKVPMAQFWAEAFDQACMLGPRMVGALLMAAPAAVQNGAKAELADLFETLRRTQ